MTRTRFERFAWFFLVYLLGIIVFGAWVRISGSGNGCGAHWPMCNGEVIPQAPAAKTIIEFTHRLTSGLSGIFGLVLVFWARKQSPRVFRASLAAMFFLLVEAFIGAVLVKKELVAGDSSAARAIVISLHLANTMLLTAASAAVAWWAGRRSRALDPASASRAFLVAALAVLLLTNMSGAVTALGDTLFPTQPALNGGLVAKVRGDISPAQHFLVRLRVIHPIVAVGATLLVFGLFRRLARQSTGESLSRLLTAGQAAIALQFGIGVLNVALAAPGWMQMVHLLAAQITWILTWLVTLEAWPVPDRVLSPSSLRVAPTHSPAA